MFLQNNHHSESILLLFSACMVNLTVIELLTVLGMKLNASKISIIGQ